MDYFVRRDGYLYCEQVPISRLVKIYGTPLYVYSLRTFVRHFAVISQAFGDTPHDIFYSVKANSNISLLRTVATLGYGCDVVSLGEYMMARKAGVRKIVFSGVGKQANEMEYALRKGVLFFGVESENELGCLEQIACSVGCQAPVAVRVNPDVNPRTHPHIATGLGRGKFGVSLSQAMRLYRIARQSPYLKPVGISMHIGSQVTSTSPYVEAAKKLKRLWLRLLAEGISLQYLDLGGGWAAPLRPDDNMPSPADYVRAMLPHLRDLHAKIIVEPGRSIVGNAGVLVMTVLRVKRTRYKTFAITDAGMNDFIRSAMYQRWHRIEPVVKKSRQTIRLDIVGPICENTDVFGKNSQLPAVHQGDLLCLFTAGAYGFSMSSNYNGRPRPAEVLVNGRAHYLIREREKVGDLWRRQRYAPIKQLPRIVL